MLKLATLILVVIIFLSFFLLANWAIDPDFGWHLRNGQIILTQGIPQKDPYSYTMPSYRYVDYEWLGDAALARLFGWTGMTGAALVTAGLAIISLLVPLWLLKKRWLPSSLLLLALGAVTIYTFVLVRPVLITWLFFSLLLAIAWQESTWRKFRWFLPVIFTFWANLHAGFIAGWILVFVNGMAGLGKLSRKELLTNYGVILLSVLATLINPYGWRLWLEIWWTISNHEIFLQIEELLPTWLSFDPIFSSLVVLGGFLTLRYWHKFDHAQKWVMIATLVLGFWSQRNVPILTIVLLPVIALNLENFRQEMDEMRVDSQRRRLATKFVYTGAFILIALDLFLIVKSSLDLNRNFYPEKAVAFLHSNLTAGQVFSHYNWGGYLIWKLPEKKVFVDGRMLYWQGPSSQTESSSAFREFQSLGKSPTNYRQVFKKYQVTQVLWPTPIKDKNTYLDHLKNYLARLTGQKSNSFDFLSALSKDGWQIVYQDQTATLLEKPMVQSK